MTTTSLFEVNGGVTSAAGKPVSTATQCLTDTFTVTGGGGSNPPTICGTNTGQHGEGSSVNDVIISKFQPQKNSNDHPLDPKAVSIVYRWSLLTFSIGTSFKLISEMTAVGGGHELRFG